MRATLKAGARRALGAGFFIAFIFLGIRPGLAEATDSTQSNLIFDAALKQFQDQHLPESEATLRRLLKSAPEHPQGNLLLGILLNRKQQFKEAISALKVAEKSLKDDPKLKKDLYSNLGAAQFQSGDFSAAASSFAVVAAINPSADSQQNLALSLLKAGKAKESVVAWKKAAEATPKSLQAWTGLAEAANAAGDTVTAISAWEKSLALAPQDKRLRLGLGQRYFQAGADERAAAVLGPMQGMGDAEAEYLLGVLAYRGGRFDESRTRFDAALALKPDFPEARYNLAITLYDQGDYEKALAQFDAVLALHPSDKQAKENRDRTRQIAVRSWLRQGSQDFVQGDYLRAVERWQAALRLDPSNKVIKDLLETAQAQLKLQAVDLAAAGDKAKLAGDWDAAIGAWAGALERDPDNAAAKAGLDASKSEADRLIASYTQRVKAALDDGRYPAALQAVDRASALDKAKGAVLRKQVDGWAAARVGAYQKEADQAVKKKDLASVVSVLEAALPLRPGDADLTLRLNRARVALRAEADKAQKLGEQAEKAGKLSEAGRHYKRLLELRPGDGAARAALQRVVVSQPQKDTVKSKPAVQGADTDDLYYQGVYAYAAGETDKAIGLWKQVLSIDSKHRLSKEAIDRALKKLSALKRS